MVALLGLAGIDLPAQYRVASGAASVGAAIVERAEQLVQRGLARMQQHFPGVSAAPMSVLFYRTRDELPERVRAVMHDGSPGVALLQQHEIHIVLEAVQDQAPGDLGTVIDHEIVHLLLHDFAGVAGPYVPRWIHEGLAQHLTGFLYVGAQEEQIVFAARTDTLPRFRDLQRDFPGSSGYDLRIAYAISQSFASFLVRQVGLPRLLAVVRGCRADQEFPEAFYAEVGVPLTSFEQEWLEYVRSGSGAAYRVVMGQCFSLLMVLALPLLALAAARRWNADAVRQRRLTSEEAAAKRLNEAEVTDEQPPAGDEE